jgi:hypothetical protein
MFQDRRLCASDRCLVCLWQMYCSAYYRCLVCLWRLNAAHCVETKEVTFNTWFWLVDKKKKYFQLDATDDFYCRSYCLLNMFRTPLCPSSGAREYHTDGCCLCYLVLWFSSCRYGVELRVMCSEQPANRTHNPDDGHSGARNMLSKQ